MVVSRSRMYSNAIIRLDNNIMKNQISNKRILTVGELIEDLKFFDQDAEIHFEGFQFYRTKKRGGKLVQIELVENTYENE